MAATPVPSAPSGLARIATVEQDGIRIQIELERNPLPAGEPTEVRTRLTNTGSDVLQWLEDCPNEVLVDGRFVDLPFRAGRRLDNPGGALKAFILEVRAPGPTDRWISFSRGGMCSEVAITKSLAPGRTIERRARWDGFTAGRLAPPPTGAVDLTGSFGLFWRAAEGEPEPFTDRRLQAHLDAWIDGVNGLLDPAEAVDVAVADPRLAALFAVRDPQKGTEGVVRFDPATAAYQVGLLESGQPARVHLVLVDVRTGANVGWVERDWDYTVDGYP